MQQFQIRNKSGDVVAFVEKPNADTIYNFKYEVNDTNYGDYTFAHSFNLTSNDYDAYGINLTI